MFRRFMKKRLAVGGLAAVGALALAVGAYAYFTATNTTSGTGSVGSATPWAVADTSTPTTLYPGQGSFAITGTVTNNGSGNQGLNSVVVTITAPSGGGGFTGEADCSAEDFALTAASGTDWVISNGGDTATYSWTDAQDVQPGADVAFPDGLSISMVDNTSAPQDNCQKATVNWTDTAS